LVAGRRRRHRRVILSEGLLASGFVGTALELADPFFHFLTRLERHHKLLWHKDFLARAGVSGLTCGAAFDFKDAKVSQLDAVVFNERLDDRIKGLLNDLFGL
jgi:hypothetical protein